LMNCFNKIIFFVSITNYNFTFCPEMGNARDITWYKTLDFVKKWT